MPEFIQACVGYFLQLVIIFGIPAFSLMFAWRLAPRNWNIFVLSGISGFLVMCSIVVNIPEHPEQLTWTNENVWYFKYFYSSIAIVIKYIFENFIIFFEKYQTFLAGILGFGGVIYTMSANARLYREQHEHQVNHERDALRTAIYAELELTHKILEDRCKVDLESEILQPAFFPEYISNQIYIQFINKIGLLSDIEIEVIMEAYALLNDLPLRLKLLSANMDSSFDRQGYIFIDSKNIESAIHIHKSFIPKIDLALKILKTRKAERASGAAE